MTHEIDIHTGASAPLMDAEIGRSLENFTQYWRSKRRGNDVPRRSDIDPRGIEALLANAFIIERIAPGLARVRIAGSHLTDLMGMEVRGMPISAFIAPSARDALAHDLVHVFDAPATLRLSLSAPARPSAPAMTGTMLILPLRSDLGDVSRALGCLMTTGTPGRGPRRFDITAKQLLPTGPGHSPAARPRLVTDRPVQAPKPQRGRRAHLRLVT